jgi:hypothetical protein
VLHLKGCVKKAILKAMVKRLSLKAGFKKPCENKTIISAFINDGGFFLWIV